MRHVELGNFVALVHEVVRVGGESGLGRGVIPLRAKADFRVVVLFIIIRIGQRGIRVHARLALDDVLDAVAVGVGIRRIGDDRVRTIEIFIRVGVAIAVGIAVGAVVIIRAQRIERRGDRIAVLILVGGHVLDFPTIGQTVFIRIGLRRIRAVEVFLPVGQAVGVGIEVRVIRIQRIQDRRILDFPSIGQTVAVGVVARRIQPGILVAVGEISLGSIAHGGGEVVFLKVGQAIFIGIVRGALFEIAEVEDFPIVGQTVFVFVIAEVGQGGIENHAAAEVIFVGLFGRDVEDAGVLPVVPPVFRTAEVFGGFAAVVEQILCNETSRDVTRTDGRILNQRLDVGDRLRDVPDVEVVNIQNGFRPLILLGIDDTQDQVAVFADVQAIGEREVLAGALRRVDVFVRGSVQRSGEADERDTLR